MIQSKLDIQTQNELKNMLNQIQTTEVAPVVAAEIHTQPKATRKASLPVVVRRKVLQGKHKQPGAPRLEILGLHKNRRRGAFTKHDIFDANGQTISMLTITKRIGDLRKAGELVKMAKSIKHIGPGRPPEFFNFDKSQGEAKKSRSRKVKAVDTTAPAEVAPADAPQAPQAPAPVAPEAAPVPEVAVV